MLEFVVRDHPTDVPGPPALFLRWREHLVSPDSLDGEVVRVAAAAPGDPRHAVAVYGRWSRPGAWCSDVRLLAARPAGWPDPRFTR